MLSIKFNALRRIYALNFLYRSMAFGFLSTRIFSSTNFIHSSNYCYCIHELSASWRIGSPISLIEKPQQVLFAQIGLMLRFANHQSVQSANVDPTIAFNLLNSRDTFILCRFKEPTKKLFKFANEKMFVCHEKRIASF
jgi:hypothetical protein